MGTKQRYFGIIERGNQSRKIYIYQVGQGIKASGVARESIFLTTKLDNPDQKRAPEALEDSLKKLGTTYLDLCM